MPSSFGGRLQESDSHFSARGSRGDEGNATNDDAGSDVRGGVLSTRDTSAARGARLTLRLPGYVRAGRLPVGDEVRGSHRLANGAKAAMPRCSRSDPSSTACVSR
jgi:hypothetical protein